MVQEEVETVLNGDSKKSFILVLVSLGIGAMLASVLGNEETRAKLVHASKRLLQQ